MDPEKYAILAERLIEHLVNHPEHRLLPYYVANSGHRSLTTRDKPPRRAGRPRTTTALPKRMKECRPCGGLGHVAT